MSAPPTGQRAVPLHVRQLESFGFGGTPPTRWDHGSACSAKIGASALSKDTELFCARMGQPAGMHPNPGYGRHDTPCRPARSFAARIERGRGGTDVRPQGTAEHTFELQSLMPN